MLLDEKLYKTCENVLIYDILYKIFMGGKPLRIRFNKINEFMKIYDGIRYLRLFDPWWYDASWIRMRYLIIKKSGITDSVNHDFARIRINSYNYLPIDEILTIHNVIILIKSVVNKNENNCFYNIFLEKG